MISNGLQGRKGAAEPTRWWAAFTFAIPVVYGVVLTLFARRVGTADYDQFLVFHELQYWNATLFGLAKQWSPVMCAGMSLAGEPQVPFGSLTMLLGYLLGPLAGIVAGTLLYLAIGWLGGYLYSGLWFQQQRPRMLAASLFIGNGFFICRIAHGHLDFIPFLALPLALWAIHKVSDGADPTLTVPNRILAILLLGCLFAAVIDGAPVAILHWAFWIGIYSASLAWVRRSVLPLVLFAGACGLASVLDAGYLWPMVSAQAEFPRRTADTFTGPWSLPWFMLIPMRGKLLPANGTGIELSVFIGPWLAYLIWRYRHTLRQQLPREMLMPLLLVSVISIWLGMGSLRAAHVPLWLSPFDWLRPLPGFRSMGVTGRFWGFLALPLSLLAAAALWHYLHAEPRSRHRTLLLGGALLTQLAFQGESVVSAWWPSRAYEQVPLQGLYSSGKLQPIEMVMNPTTAADPHRQGEFVSPVRGVVNCYDMDDFAHAPVHPGTSLIRSIRVAGSQAPLPPAVEAGFVTWNRIRIEAPLPAAASSGTPAGGLLHITLNQAYHTGWSSPDCQLTRGDQGNLVASCPNTLQSKPADLVFFDAVSDLGMRVSLRAAAGLAGAALTLGLLSLIPRRRPVTSPAA
ncbi:MAG: hypothetical protein JWO52_333 [Gammaproteobacteria bacterium]|nr:hypothetical protein [Gammaproteobacteria bacterium]